MGTVGRKRFTEEQIVLALRRHDSGKALGGDHPQAGDQRADVLPLACLKICQADGVRANDATQCAAGDHVADKMVIHRN